MPTWSKWSFPTCRRRCCGSRGLFCGGADAPQKRKRRTGARRCVGVLVIACTSIYNRSDPLLGVGPSPFLAPLGTSTSSPGSEEPMPGTRWRCRESSLGSADRAPPTHSPSLRLLLTLWPRGSGQAPGTLTGSEQRQQQ